MAKSRADIELPTDKRRHPIYGVGIEGAALAKTYDATISSATSITLNADTTYIEVTAITKGVFLKYAAGVTTSDFDEYIPAETSKGFVLPDSVTVVSVIEQSATAAVVVIEK